MEEKKIGILSVISIITGVLALIIGVLAIIGVPAFVALILALAAIPTGIIALVKKEKVAMPVIGIVTAVIAVIVAIVMTVFYAIGVGIDSYRNSSRRKELDNELINLQSSINEVANLSNYYNSTYNYALNTYNYTNSLYSSNSTSNTIISNNTNSTNTTSTPSTNTQRVGSADFGYVTIPSNWNKFYDPDAPKTLQYSQGYSYILTMYAENTSQVSAEQYAKSTMAKMKSENTTSVTGATVSLGKYTAYQVYGYYPSDNTWLVCWHFEAEDGKTHYISVEGSDSTNDAFNIPDTFSLTR